MKVASGSALRFSKHCQFIFLSDWNEQAAPSLLDFLLKKGRAILLPVTVRSHQWMSFHEKELSSNWDLPPLPSKEHFQIALDKGKMNAFLEERGLPRASSLSAHEMNDFKTA